MAKRKKVKLTQRELYLVKRMLYEDDQDKPLGHVYDPNFHPDHMVKYFQDSYDKILDPERFETEHRLEWKMKPVRPPTIAGYCASIGISRNTLFHWGKKYDEMAEAIDKCKTIQEAGIVEMGSCGGFNPGFASMMMKNFHGWADKVEQKHEGGLTLNFDSQDEDA
jgi:hypothetical protein